MLVSLGWFKYKNFYWVVDEIRCAVLQLITPTTRFDNINAVRQLLFHSGHQKQPCDRACLQVSVLGNTFMDTVETPLSSRFILQIKTTL